MTGKNGRVLLDRAITTGLLDYVDGRPSMRPFTFDFTKSGKWATVQISDVSTETISVDPVFDDVQVRCGQKDKDDDDDDDDSDD